MCNKFHHLIDDPDAMYWAERLLIESVTDALRTQSRFQGYASDLEELTRFTDDPRFHRGAASMARFYRHLCASIGTGLAAMREEARASDVIELTGERLEPETVYDAGCSTSDEERDQ